MWAHSKCLRGLRRVLALGLGAVLMTGTSLADAVPAHAEAGVTVAAVPAVHSVSGRVGIRDGEEQVNYFATIRVQIVELGLETETTGDPVDGGGYSFEDVPDGDYTLEFVSQDAYAPTATATVPVSITPQDPAEFELANVDLAPLPDLPGGEVQVTGDQIVGHTVQGEVSGFPAGTRVEYQWGFSTGQSGDTLEDVNDPTLVVPRSVAGYFLALTVTAFLEGYTPTSESYFSAVRTVDPQRDPIGAPVADSAELDEFLTLAGATRGTSESAGLPAGGLDPAEDYSAAIAWQSPDSFVDVYAFSAPVFVGTFAVIDGTLTVSLSSDLLSEIEVGVHTLVAVGQSSGAVQSVAFATGPTLASTGFDAGLPLGIAMVLLLLGAALLLSSPTARLRSLN
jgi:hypothetical protein